MHDELVIREGVPADAAAIAAFNLAMALETEGRRLDEATVRRGVEGGLARPEACRYYVAEVAGVVAGQLMITYEWSDWRNGMFWWIQSVYVAPEHRGRGIFRRLFQHVHDLARATPGICGLRLYVEHNNAAAQACYERLGLTPTDYQVYEVDWS